MVEGALVTLTFRRQVLTILKNTPRYNTQNVIIVFTILQIYLKIKSDSTIFTSPSIIQR